MKKLVTCPWCSGEGKVEALQPDKPPYRPDAAQVWKWEECDLCEGTGQIEELWKWEDNDEK